MSVDNNFLPKMIYFLEQTKKATERTNYVNKDWFEAEYKPFLSIFTSLCQEFCDMVIRKSEFVWGTQRDKIRPIYGGSLTLEDLCGMIPDPEEQNRYWYMSFHPANGEYTNFSIVEGKWVFYELSQINNKTITVRLCISLDDFNKFLNWAFSYLDVDCFKAFNLGGV